MSQHVPNTNRYDAFLSGEIGPEDLQEHAHRNVGESPEYGTHLPIYTLQDSIRNNVEIIIQRAALYFHLGETGLVGFAKAPRGIVVPVQSCRNMYMITLWAMDGESCDQALDTFWRICGQPDPRYEISVPEGWSFNDVMGMVQAFNFKHFRRLDPYFRDGEHDEIFSRLNQKDWFKDVTPLGGNALPRSSGGIAR